MLWDVASGAYRRPVEIRSGVRQISFSPDGKLLAALGTDGKVRLWELPAEKPPRLLPVPRGVPCGISFTPDARILLGLSEDEPTPTSSAPAELHLWDLFAGKERATFKGHRGYAGAVDFSPDRKTLASTSWTATSNGPEGEVELWDMTTGRLRHRVPTLAHALVFSRDGESLFTVSGADVVRVWDVATGTERPGMRSTQARICHLAIAADGRRLATGASDSTVLIWDLDAVRRVQAWYDKPTLFRHLLHTHSSSFFPGNSA